MIISDKYKYSFIRLHRTASTSISRYLNDKEDKWEDFVEQIASRSDLEFVAGKPVDPHHVPHFLARHFVPDSLEKYFTFSFVRNPWDRFVSAWRYMGRDSNSSQPFEEFIKLLEREVKTGASLTWEYLSLPQSDFIGSPDFTGKFETLDDDFSLICETLGLPVRKLKKRNTTGGKHYKEYYTSKTKNIVSELYKKDIERFKYVYD